MQHRKLARRWRVAAGLGATALFAFHASPQATAERYDAGMNYRLHCEGCHKADGSGQPGYIPELRGHVARFLGTDEGRAYLARVPGTAQSLLTDEERAEVLNWIVRTFDPDHLPAGFTPYTTAEVARWRYDALSQPSPVRARLVAQMGTAPDVGSPAATASRATSSPATAAPAPAGPPAAFAACAICHTVTADGVPGIGPNLHGVVGRKAGSTTSFAYSPAMRGVGFEWTSERLDAFLTAPATAVPGNYMSFPGLPEPAERQAVIEYLRGLR